MPTRGFTEHRRVPDLVSKFRPGSMLPMGCLTNVPVADLVIGKPIIAHKYDGLPIEPDHGGPARLLVPHLFIWNSVKW